MFAHVDTESVESLVGNITKDQAVALVCCYHGKPYHGESRAHRALVCEQLRARGLLHPQHWACTFLGSKVAIRLA